MKYIRKYQRDKNQRGFTIVELLIVIVVIAILAAITIISYNGITQKAEASRIVTVLNTYEKALKLQAVNKGSLPSESGCLGLPEDYPVTPDFAEGACVMYGATVSAQYDENVMNSLTEFLSTKPSANIPPVTIDFSGDIYRYRGIWFQTYASGSGYSFELQYVLSGNRECPRGDSSYEATSDATRCMVTVDW